MKEGIFFKMFRRFYLYSFSVLFLLIELLFSLESVASPSPSISHVAHQINSMPFLKESKGINTSPRTPDLMREYLADTEIFYTFTEHLFINSTMGLIMGSIQGGLIGFFDFESKPASTDGRFSTLALSLGILSSVGFLTGMGISVIEYYNNQQFTIGPTFMQYTFYGTFFGAFVGALIGGGLYGKTGNLDNLINITSYGALAGLFVGLSSYFLFDIFAISKFVQLSLNYDPWQSEYTFGVTNILSF